MEDGMKRSRRGLHLSLITVTSVGVVVLHIRLVIDDSAIYFKTGPDNNCLVYLSVFYFDCM